MYTQCRLRCGVLAMVLLVATSAFSPAHAQSAEETAANLLYTDGKAAFDAGDFAQALTLFQQAYEVLQNDFIRFYLGRTQAALGHCERALEHFGELTTRLPPDPREKRRVDEVQCRLLLAKTHLDGFRCHEALMVLKPIDKQLRKPAERRDFAAFQGTAKQCTDVFGTRTAIGQKAARLYAEARTALRADNAPKALDLARKSLAAKPSRPASSVAAIALGRLDRCPKAIPKLEAAIEHASADDKHIMEGLAVQCRLSEGKRLLTGGNCQEVLDMLDPLKGKLKGHEEVWRKQKVAWCRPRATEFLTDTAPRQAAYKLFLAARAALESPKRGEIQRAVGLYQKALKLVDEPLIRRELAEAAVRIDDCPLAAEALDAIPEKQRQPPVRGLLAACQRYKAPDDIRGAALQAHVAGVREVLRLRGAGAHAKALEHLKTLATAQLPAMQALALDLVYDTGRCEDFARGFEDAADEVLAHVTQGELRFTECQEAPAVNATETDIDTDTVSVSATASPEAGSGTVGWITVGSGAALAVAGVAFSVLWSDAASRHDAAQGRYRTGSVDEALGAIDDMAAAKDDGTLYSGLALGLGLAGAAVITTGVVLLLTGDDGAPGGDVSSLRIHPVVGPSYLGMGGRF